MPKVYTYLLPMSALLSPDKETTNKILLSSSICVPYLILTYNFGDEATSYNEAPVIVASKAYVQPIQEQDYLFLNICV